MCDPYYLFIYVIIYKMLGIKIDNVVQFINITNMMHYFTLKFCICILRQFSIIKCLYHKYILFIINSINV